LVVHPSSLARTSCLIPLNLFRNNRPLRVEFTLGKLVT
jgi:hypothetical protein